MRKISANYIFPGTSPPLKNGIIVLDDSGEILEIQDTGGTLREIAKLEFYNGIIVPGFVNAHCHLELSHLRNLIPKHTGLAGFIFEVSRHRNESRKTVLPAMKQGEEEMLRNGIVAVGDISNTEDSFAIKANGNIYYHTFIEVFGLDPGNAESIIAKAKNLADTLQKKAPLPFSIIPHAPYSVSPSLFREISLLENNTPLSIHNQETEGERILFRNKKGSLYNILSELVPEFQNLIPRTSGSLEYILENLKNIKKLLLVHNTFTTASDLLFSLHSGPQKCWVFCPNANLYIENTLPDIQLFRNKNQQIALGTDSLASNDHLSILEEMKTIAQHFPEVPLEEMITWATFNGAEALNISEKYGKIEPGRKPGLNLIYDLDLSELKLTEKTRVKRLI
jgi:cytosine/adenosine deaminase-related metal-dependent hydrolase